MPRGRTIVFVILAQLLLPGTIWAWTGKVVRVIDGDSIVATHDEKRVEIRLYGIDCPEWQQAFSQKAKTFTAKSVLGKVVGVYPLDTDRYGRTLSIVTVDQRMLNEALIAAGLAWVHPKCLPMYALCRRWRDLQKEARAERRGLWADPHPIPPWEVKRKK